MGGWLQFFSDPRPLSRYITIATFKAWITKRANEQGMQTIRLSNKLSETPKGRALLHLICLIRDGHVRWHVAGIKRELSD